MIFCIFLRGICEINVWLVYKTIFLRGISLEGINFYPTNFAHKNKLLTFPIEKKGVWSRQVQSQDIHTRNVYVSHPVYWEAMKIEK